MSISKGPTYTDEITWLLNHVALSTINDLQDTGCIIVIHLDNVWDDILQYFSNNLRVIFNNVEDEEHSTCFRNARNEFIIISKLSKKEVKKLLKELPRYFIWNDFDNQKIPIIFSAWSVSDKNKQNWWEWVVSVLSETATSTREIIEW